MQMHNYILGQLQITTWIAKILKQGWLIEQRKSEFYFLPAFCIAPLL